jgi:ParB-like chromosome segregation protein Spo0J
VNPVVEYALEDIRHAPAAVPEQVNDLVPRLRGGLGIPPVWLDATGLLVDGHHRVAAAIEAGWSTVPAIVLTEDQDDEFERLLEEEGCSTLGAFEEVSGHESPPNHRLRGRFLPRDY